MTSISISKITPPFLPSVLNRLRLLCLLEDNKDKKLILLLGQAAQGKTTLAASYIRLLDAPSAWITLDKGDSDPIYFYNLIIQAIQHALQDSDLTPLLSYPSMMIRTRPDVPLFRELTQALFELVLSPIHIVIDNLERLPTDTPIFKFLHILMENSPPNIHLIMLSREMLPSFFDFQHLKMSQQALVLTNEDLAFTLDEVKELFKNIRRISLDVDQLKKIYSVTEGWIGGLILLCESLSRIPESVRGAFISGELPDHFEREVFQYFGKEIFLSQPEQVRAFLIKSSLFDIVEPHFMKDFTGIENAEEILRELERKHLFVQSFYDEEKGCLFRFHQMFKKFLKDEFRNIVGDEERQSMFLKAGYICEERNELDNSIKYFLEAKAYPQAASVIERLGIDLIRRGRINDLSQWIVVLPEDTIQENAWLLFYLAMIKKFTAGKENLIAVQRANTLFKEKGDMKGELLSLSQLISFSVHTGTHLTPLAWLIEEGEKILQSLESEKYPYERATLWYRLGLGHILGGGDIRRGIWACENAYLISKQIGDINLQVYALTLSMLAFIFLGEFSSINETDIKVEKIVAKSVYSEFRAVYLMVQCVRANYQGDFLKAQVLAENLRSEIEKYGFVYIYPWVYETLGISKLSQRNFLEAEEIGGRYLNTALSLKNAFLKGLALRLLGLIYLHEGDVKKAKEVITQSMEAFLNEAPSKYELNRARIIMGLINSHLKDYGSAEKELEEAFKYFNEILSYNSLVETHFAIALLQSAQEKNKEAVFHLQNGFKIAEEKKYEYFYLLGHEYLMRPCLLALELKVEGAMDYAAYLLSSRLSVVAEEGLKKLSNHPDSKTREKIRGIRSTIHRLNVPRLRVETLGRFRVFRGDSLIKKEEWDRIQPKQLLMAILARGGQRTPKEVLIDDLWPDERPDAAENNFKTALQRLRKSLEPVIHKDFSSSYVHLHDNCVIVDQELCQVDAALFLSLIKKGEEKEKGGDIKNALSLYAEAMELYQGDFLPEELYLPEVDRKREELREKFIGLLHKLANLHERRGAVRKAIECHKKAIQTDPLLEESYQKLMTLYSNRGMYNEALRMYEACKKALKVGLKTKPDAMTTALYNKILEKIQST